MTRLTAGTAWSRGNPLPDPLVAGLRERSAAAAPSELARRLLTDGYVVVRGALDVEAVRAARADRRRRPLASLSRARRTASSSP